MRFAVDVPNFGDFADPRVVADLARRAEQAGWDGLFVWDHITTSGPGSAATAIRSTWSYPA
jgi:alkanesulfonate monooxygenase SsuD/methylene tetrahydromethanopterin reductase-like flavin-dependent oxidoreductase (luciferase family)